MSKWDELKTRVEAEAEARPMSIEAEENWAHEPNPVAISTTEEASNNPTPPAGQDEIATTHHRRDFVAIPPREFLGVASLAILRRPPASLEESTYLPLCTTWLGRVAVLAMLSSSAEAKISVQGVRRWYSNYLLAHRIPGTRYWLGLINRLLKWLDRPAQIEALGLEISNHSQQAQQQIDRHSQQTAHQSQLIDKLTQKTQKLDKQLPLLAESLEIAHKHLSTLLENPEAESKVRDADALDSFYLSFENACRGEESNIRARLEAYLPLIQTAHHSIAVDVGCGRGEWLALLREQGFETHGVELSQIMAEHCREQDLQVTISDGLSWLQNQPEGELGMVTAFHVLEHVPFDYLLTTVQEAFRVLHPGGLVIFETPNPENLLVGAHTFYHDPTHRNPLTPALLEFVLQYAGFTKVETLRLNPYPPEAIVPGDGTVVERINGHFYGPQDFAVVGFK